MVLPGEADPRIPVRHTAAGRCAALRTTRQWLARREVSRRADGEQNGEQRTETAIETILFLAFTAVLFLAGLFTCLHPSAVRDWMNRHGVRPRGMAHAPGPTTMRAVGVVVMGSTAILAAVIVAKVLIR